MFCCLCKLTFLLSDDNNMCDNNNFNTVHSKWTELDNCLHMREFKNYVKCHARAGRYFFSPQIYFINQSCILIKPIKSEKIWKEKTSTVQKPTTKIDIQLNLSRRLAITTRDADIRKIKLALGQMNKTKMKKLIRMSSILSENFQMGRKIKERNKKKSTCFLYRIENESSAFHKIKNSDSTKQFRNNNNINHHYITTSSSIKH